MDIIIILQNVLQSWKFIMTNISYRHMSTLYQVLIVLDNIKLFRETRIDKVIKWGKMKMAHNKQHINH